MTPSPLYTMVLPGLDLAAVLFLRYSMPTERLKSIFSLGAAASAKASLLCLLSYALIIPNVINEPIDNLITRDACAATTYGVVAFVSTTTLLLSVGWRGLHVLWTTLTVNFVAGLCYVLRATHDVDPRRDFFSVNTPHLRYATWFHTMPLMALLCAHAASCELSVALDMVILAASVIYAGWLAGGFTSFLPCVLGYTLSAVLLGLLTSMLYDKLLLAAPAESQNPLDALLRGQEMSVRALAMAIVVSWWAFPILQGLTAVDLLDGDNYDLLIVVIETCTKTLCTLVMMQGRIETLEQRHERAQGIENWRLAEQLRAETIFVSYVFHEMRNPYNGIAGHLSCMGDTIREAQLCLTESRGSTLPAAAKRRLASCVDQLVEDVSSANLCSQHMSDVLNNVLDLRRIEEGAMTLSQKPFDGAAVVLDVRDMIRPQEGVRLVASVVDGATGARLDSLPIVGDAVRLRQILLNLLGNACKHTIQGSIEIIATVYSNRRSLPANLIDEPLQNGYVAVTFEVRDTGCGIDAEHQRTVFAKYVIVDEAGSAPGRQRSGSTEPRLAQSTGLGLAVAQQLVALMGGELRLTSPVHEGRGTRFHFTVLLRTGELHGNEETAAADAAASDELVKRSLPPGLRCLVADDLYFNRKLLRRYLTTTEPFNTLSWNVEECDTGEGVIERVCDSQQRYDILFLDEHYETAGGKLRGSEVLGVLKARVSPEQMPVLITTSGNCLPEDVAYYSSCGADDTFGKPLPNKYDLGRRLLTLLKRKHGAAFIDGNDSPPIHDDKRQRPPPRQSARKRSAPGR